MPKGKPCKGLVKRVRVTKNGKVMARGSGSTHRRVVKTAAAKRRVRQIRPLHPTAANVVKKALGLK